MRSTGPKNKIARREGMDLGLKTLGSKSQAALLRRVNTPPGQHGMRRRRKISERARQLREKQKLRFMFGVTESQMKNYFKKAIMTKGNTAILMSQLLEKRLDNVVYRLGFAPTRASARQLVSHRHVKINGKIVNIASYQVAIGQTVGFAKPSSTKIVAVEESLKNEGTIIPEWLDRKGEMGKLKTDPTSDTIEKQINLRSVIEFYSK